MFSSMFIGTNRTSSQVTFREFSRVSTSRGIYADYICVSFPLEIIRTILLAWTIDLLSEFIQSDVEVIPTCLAPSNSFMKGRSPGLGPYTELTKRTEA